VSGDHFPNKYFPERFFPGGYFQGGEVNAGSMSASLSGSGDITALLVGVQVQAEDTGGRGGWDPYYYKKRNKRRDQRRDVVKFVEEVAEAPLAQAPVEIREQAQEALEAARLALQIAELEAMQKALREINEFYALIRAEAKRLRDDEEDDLDLLLLAA
jgi:hypothetical protein